MLSQKNKKHLIKGKYEKINNLFDYLNSVFDIYQHCNEQNTFIKNKKIIFIYLDKTLSFNIEEDEKKNLSLKDTIKQKNILKNILLIHNKSPHILF